jgi:nucleoside-triphosphatase THEP1
MFDLPAEAGAVILVSGERRVGKTTALLKVRETAIRVGLRVGGFLSVARFDDAQKTGIDLMDAASGEVMPLATMVSGAASGDPTGGAGGVIRTGHYTFNPAALAAGRRYAEAGQDADVFLVDELGPLELLRGEGWADVIPMIRVRRFGAALVVVRPELIELSRGQMDLPLETPVILIDETNREALAVTLINWIRQRTVR